jgi:hypothetical protein
MTEAPAEVGLCPWMLIILGSFNICTVDIPSRIDGREDSRKSIHVMKEKNYSAPGNSL